MRRVLIMSCLLIGLVSAISIQADFPQAHITNGVIQATLYLPDAKNGYYQGTRFDWSGVIGSLTYKEHNYFGPWFEKHDPKIHDAITGPVEAFVPIGYEQAKPGDDFVIIGVGALRKGDAPKYHFANPYEITNPGKWSVSKKKDQVQFVHELKEATGYSYRYQKNVRLVKGKPQLILEHRLKNTGSRSIETKTYNHNFFVIDKEPTGPGILTTFPFEVEAKGGLGKEGLAEVQSKQIVYLRQLQKGENAFNNNVQGFGTTAKDYDFRIENQKSGAGVRITGDQPLSKIVFWSCYTTSCPEPYIDIQAKPGEEITWNITYEFYTLPNSSK
ncbi:hypothetical protein GXP67_36060 [Rhodocytophaga rosea]|uniref:Uncharacterized protein n=1 Tax=Rhodocytophaga rosea TaxID=2704465 RepID=A0A6C0GU28_9BACT|nr:hypothetical protein [Rhodocytophaga rosea]QHT71701.1 hypothetical protein GXP67_36060 [Rhodocytophaga rosea]